jgi:Protein of unknown function (DUF2591)
VALDWAVSKAQGLDLQSLMIIDRYLQVDWRKEGRYKPLYEVRGLEFIESELISIQRRGGHWIAGRDDQELATNSFVGKTLLEAAMRCFVFSVLGDEVEIPKELA